MEDFNVTGWFKNQYLTEAGEATTQATQLAKLINDSIISIDDSMSYKDFAEAVAKVLIDDYGQHNFDPFMKVLHAKLGIQESINEYGAYKSQEVEIEKELNKLFDSNASVYLGDYSSDRDDSDPLKNKSFGKITFNIRDEFSDPEWEKIVDFVKSKGFEVTQDSNYYDIEPGEREWFPSINFNFNTSNI
jgi:hypothetical protein|tara:strand:+ start:2094 stop:2660 length:567 start_codon:yes stop_codon:yes gene_type:complete